MTDILLTFIQVKQQSLEQWGQSLASTNFSIQIKHRNTSARLYNKRFILQIMTTINQCLLSSVLFIQTSKEWSHRRFHVPKGYPEVIYFSKLNLTRIDRWPGSCW